MSERGGEWVVRAQRAPPFDGISPTEIHEVEMPLLPLPEDNTARLFVNYTHGSVEHEVQVRLLSPFTQSDLVGWFHTWLDNRTALFGTDVEFHSADWADANSSVRNPVSWVPISGAGTPSTSLGRYSRSFSFVGRSPDGRKVRLFFYGMVYGEDVTYRVYGSEDIILQQAVDGLNALNSRIGTISGSAPIFKPYLNIRNNAYWQTELRG